MARKKGKSGRPKAGEPCCGRPNLRKMRQPVHGLMFGNHRQPRWLCESCGKVHRQLPAFAKSRKAKKTDNTGTHRFCWCGKRLNNTQAKYCSRKCFHTKVWGSPANLAGSPGGEVNGK